MGADEYRIPSLIRAIREIRGCPPNIFASREETNRADPGI